MEQGKAKKEKDERNLKKSLQYAVDALWVSIACASELRRSDMVVSLADIVTFIEKDFFPAIGSDRFIENHEKIMPIEQNPFEGKTAEEIKQSIFDMAEKVHKQEEIKAKSADQLNK